MASESQQRVARPDVRGQTMGASILVPPVCFLSAPGSLGARIITARCSIKMYVLLTDLRRTIVRWVRVVPIMLTLLEHDTHLSDCNYTRVLYKHCHWVFTIEFFYFIMNDLHYCISCVFPSVLLNEHGTVCTIKAKSLNLPISLRFRRCKTALRLED